MALCAGITKSGQRCRAQAMSASAYCLNHAPNADELRKRRASKGGHTGGRGRACVELKRLQARFEELAEEALKEDAQRGNIAVAVQTLAQARACVRDGLVAREHEALAQEVEEMREAVSLIRERSSASTHYGSSG